MPNGQDASESARTLEGGALRKTSAYSCGRDRLCRLWTATDLDARKVVDAVMSALLTLQPPVDVLRWSFGRFPVKGGGSFRSITLFGRIGESSLMQFSYRHRPVAARKGAIDAVALRPPLVLDRDRTVDGGKLLAAIGIPVEMAFQR